MIVDEHGLIVVDDLSFVYVNLVVSSVQFFSFFFSLVETCPLKARTLKISCR